MANEQMKEMLHELLEDLEKQKADMSTLQQRLAAITASATSTNNLVTAWVNTKGILIQLRFHPNAVEKAGGLSNLSRYITEATQKAAQEAQVKQNEVLAPMRERMKKLPKMSELYPGLPDVNDFVPKPVSPSVEPPDSPARAASPGSKEHYEDVEDSRQSGRGPIDTAW